jgi:hypothetical protein
MTAAPERGRDTARASLADLAGYFLTLGTTAFGGPAAHIAMMEEQVVRRRPKLPSRRNQMTGHRRGVGLRLGGRGALLAAFDQAHESFDLASSVFEPIGGP